MLFPREDSRCWVEGLKNLLPQYPPFLGPPSPPPGDPRGPPPQPISPLVLLPYLWTCWGPTPIPRHPHLNPTPGTSGHYPALTLTLALPIQISRAWPLRVLGSLAFSFVYASASQCDLGLSQRPCSSDPSYKASFSQIRNQANLGSGSFSFCQPQDGSPHPSRAKCSPGPCSSLILLSVALHSTCGDWNRTQLLPGGAAGTPGI